MEEPPSETNNNHDENKNHISVHAHTTPGGIVTPDSSERSTSTTPSPTATALPLDWTNMAQVRRNRTVGAKRRQRSTSIRTKGGKMFKIICTREEGNGEDCLCCTPDGKPRIAQKSLAVPAGKWMSTTHPNKKKTKKKSPTHLEEFSGETQLLTMASESHNKNQIQFPGPDQNEPIQQAASIKSRHQRTPNTQTRQDQNNKSLVQNTNLSEKESKHVQHGWAVFCLHELDCTWFQGYYFPNARSTTSTGITDTASPQSLINHTSANQTSIPMLAVQRPMDDCLQCPCGGYQEMNLTLFHKRATTHQSKESITIPVICTGGDMMAMHQDETALSHQRQKQQKLQPSETKQERKLEGVSFDPETLFTKKKALPYMRRLFSSLLRKQKEALGQMGEKETKGEEQGDMREEDLFPDCAIVIGRMELCYAANTIVEDDNDAI